MLWADEILLVDSFSTDRTVEIARTLPDHRSAARVLRLGGAEELGARPGAARLGADHRRRRAGARGAGARDPDAARDRARRSTASTSGARTSSSTRSSATRAGRPTRSCGSSGADKGRYPNRRVHADLEIEGPVPVLKNPFLHYTFRTFDQYFPQVPQLRRVGRGAGLPRRPQGRADRARLPALVALRAHLLPPARHSRRHARPRALLPAGVRRLPEVRPALGVPHPRSARREGATCPPSTTATRPGSGRTTAADLPFAGHGPHRIRAQEGVLANTGRRVDRVFARRSRRRTCGRSGSAGRIVAKSARRARAAGRRGSRRSRRSADPRRPSETSRRWRAGSGSAIRPDRCSAHSSRAARSRAGPGRRGTRRRRASPSSHACRRSTCGAFAGRAPGAQADQRAVDQVDVRERLQTVRRAQDAQQRSKSGGRPAVAISVARSAPVLPSPGRPAARTPPRCAGRQQQRRSRRRALRRAPPRPAAAAARASASAGRVISSQTLPGRREGCELRLGLGSSACAVRCRRRRSRRGAARWRRARRPARARRACPSSGRAVLTRSKRGRSAPSERGEAGGAHARGERATSRRRARGARGARPGRAGESRSPSSEQLREQTGPERRRSARSAATRAATGRGGLEANQPATGSPRERAGRAPPAPHAERARPAAGDLAETGRRSSPSPGYIGRT